MKVPYMMYSQLSAVNVILVADDFSNYYGGKINPVLLGINEKPLLFVSLENIFMYPFKCVYILTTSLERQRQIQMAVDRFLKKNREYDAFELENSLDHENPLISISDHSNFNIQSSRCKKFSKSQHEISDSYKDRRTFERMDGSGEKISKLGNQNFKKERAFIPGRFAMNNMNCSLMSSNAFSLCKGKIEVTSSQKENYLFISTDISASRSSSDSVKYSTDESYYENQYSVNFSNQTGFNKKTMTKYISGKTLGDCLRQIDEICDDPVYLIYNALSFLITPILRLLDSIYEENNVVYSGLVTFTNESPDKIHFSVLGIKNNRIVYFQRDTRESNACEEGFFDAISENKNIIFRSNIEQNIICAVKKEFIALFSEHFEINTVDEMVEKIVALNVYPYILKATFLDMKYLKKSLDIKKVTRILTKTLEIDSRVIWKAIYESYKPSNKNLNEHSCVESSHYQSSYIINSKKFCEQKIFGNFYSQPHGAGSLEIKIEVDDHLTDSISTSFSNSFQINEFNDNNFFDERDFCDDFQLMSIAENSPRPVDKHLNKDRVKTAGLNNLKNLLEDEKKINPQNCKRETNIYLKNINKSTQITKARSQNDIFSFFSTDKKHKQSLRANKQSKNQSSHTKNFSPKIKYTSPRLSALRTLKNEDSYSSIQNTTNFEKSTHPFICQEKNSVINLEETKNSHHYENLSVYNGDHLHTKNLTMKHHINNRLSRFNISTVVNELLFSRSLKSPWDFFKCLIHISKSRMFSKAFNIRKLRKSDYENKKIFETYPKNNNSLSTEISPGMRIYGNLCSGDNSFSQDYEKSHQEFFLRKDYTQKPDQKNYIFKDALFSKKPCNLGSSFALRANRQSARQNIDANINLLPESSTKLKFKRHDTLYFCEKYVDQARNIQIIQSFVFDIGGSNQNFEDCLILDPNTICGTFSNKIILVDAEINLHIPQTDYPEEEELPDDDCYYDDVLHYLEETYNEFLEGKVKMSEFTKQMRIYKIVWSATNFEMVRVVGAFIGQTVTEENFEEHVLNISAIFPILHGQTKDVEVQKRLIISIDENMVFVSRNKKIEALFKIAFLLIEDGILSRDSVRLSGVFKDTNYF